jgi:GrpB-like predicted nucleotidyltransferase (UPF0157 family)
MARFVEIVAYDPAWPEAFAREAQAIEHALGADNVQLFHIGSTAVPGMPAKPIIDMLLAVDGVRKLDRLHGPLQNLDYRGLGEYGIAGRRFFCKGADDRTHHLHAFAVGSPEIDRHLRFRDFLRESEETAAAYATLKMELAQRYRDDLHGYNQAKSEFIRTVDALARERYGRNRG